MDIHLSGCHLGRNTQFTVLRERNRFEILFTPCLEVLLQFLKIFLSLSHCLCYNFNSVSLTLAIGEIKDSFKELANETKNTGNNVLVHFVITKISFILFTDCLLKIHAKRGQVILFILMKSVTKMSAVSLNGHIWLGLGLGIQRKAPVLKPLENVRKYF